MKILILTLVVLAITAASAKPSRDASWAIHKQRHGKVYDAAKDKIRRANWEKKHDMIDQHNAEFAKGLHTYEVGDNELTDLSEEEYKAMRGTTQGPAIKNGDVTTLTVSDRTTSSPVNWTTSPCMPAIKNQGQCGSCWAHSANTPIEFQTCKLNGKNISVSLSEQQLVDCSSAYGNGGCNGGFYSYAWDYVAKAVGSEYFSVYPYTATTGTCQFNSSKVAFPARKLASYSFIGSGKGVAADETAMATAVATYGPISVAIDAGTSAFQVYKSGVFNDPLCSKTTYNHAVSLLVMVPIRRRVITGSSVTLGEHPGVNTDTC